MDEVVKNLVMLVWTFSAINMNVEDISVGTLVLTEDRSAASIQAIVDFDSEESQFKKNQKGTAEDLENETQAG